MNTNHSITDSTKTEYTQTETNTKNFIPNTAIKQNVEPTKYTALPVFKEQNSGQTKSKKIKGNQTKKDEKSVPSTTHVFSKTISKSSNSSESTSSSKSNDEDSVILSDQETFVFSTTSTFSTPPPTAYHLLPNAYVSRDELSFQESGNFSIGVIKSQTDLNKKMKQFLKKEKIKINKKHFPITKETVKQKAGSLQQLMPKIEYSQLTQMSAFIELNKEKLKSLAKQNPQGLYIRREVSDLPLSLLITPAGQFIWETKKKARDEIAMGDSFKKLYKCVDHDTLKLYVSGAMSIPESNFIKKEAADREMVACKALQGLPNVAQVLHTMVYNAKPTRSTTQELQTKIKIIMEYYPNGDLNNIIKKNPLLSEQIKEQIIESLINGIEAIHSKNWIYGDFKPGNIFFDENLFPYIGDFGNVHKKSELIHAGVIAYHHPEFYIASMEDRLNSQEQQDMFALGITLAQMELNLLNLPWSDSKELGRLIQRALLVKTDPSLYLAIGEFLEMELQAFYQKFPEETISQKLIKKLIHPELSEIPTATEAKEIWENLSQSKTIEKEKD